MSKAVLFFNLKYMFRQYSFYAALAIALVIGLFGSQANYGSNDVFVNSPFAVSYFLGFVSFLMIFVVTIFCANIALRDSENKMEEIVYTTPLTKTQYLSGEFFSLAIISFLIFSAITFGMFAGSFFAPASRLGSTNIETYIYPLIIFGIPNVLFGTALLFASAKLTKNKTIVFFSGIGIYILYLILSIIGNSPLMASSESVGSVGSLLPTLIDPFGLVGYLEQTKSWTADQRNTLQISLEGNFLINRLFWLLFSTCIYFITYKAFSFRTISRKSSSKKDKNELNKISLAKNKKAIPVKIDFNQWQSFISKVAIEVRSHIKSIPFLIIMILWIALVAIELQESIYHGIFNSSYYPASGIIITLIIEPLSKLGIVIVLFFSAEIIHHEKSLKFHNLVDTYPIKNNVVILSKAFVIVGLLLILTTVSILTGIIFQTINGYYKFELGIYLSLFYYGTLPLILLSALAVFIQTLVKNKYLGMFITAAVILISLKKAAIGLEHPLLRFAATPNLIYTDMNGIGHFQDSFSLLMLYWSGFAGLLIMLSSKFWLRGTESQNKFALRNIFRNWDKTEKLLFASFLLIIGTTGFYIFNQVNIKSKYRTITEKLEYKAEYEKRYSKFETLHQPVIKDVNLNVDLFPGKRIYKVQGNYKIINKTQESIDKLLVRIHPEVGSSKIILNKANLIKKDEKFNFYIYELDKQMPPGKELTLDFSIKVEKSGFDEFNSENSIVGNGSYIELEKYVPHFGYSSDFEIADLIVRETYGLPEKEEHSQITSKKFNYEWINFSAIFSTTSGHRVVSVGNLKKEWTENNRNFFHYESDKPIPFMFACASADYEVKNQNYNGTDLQIFYHKGHSKNLETMFKSAKSSLEIYSNEFSDYQYDHLRIVEIPHYPGAATSYPGTIFFKEKIGFQYDTKDASRMNLAFLTIAHEISHQWWPGQMEPAYTAGYKVLTESLAQYSEILVYEKVFGKRFHRKYFNDAENIYLTSRSYSNYELPLFISEGSNNTHIHYQKGLMVMYSIKEMIGEDIFNKALIKLLDEYSYPNEQAETDDFIEILYDVSPPQKHFLIDELMKNVMLYDLKIENSSVRKTSDGNYEIIAEIKIDKEILDNSKTEQIDKINQRFDIGLFSDHPDMGNYEDKIILINKMYFESNKKRIRLIVSEKPTYISIDPYGYIIDKNRMNNLQKLAESKN